MTKFVGKLEKLCIKEEKCLVALASELQTKNIETNQQKKANARLKG